MVIHHKDKNTLNDNIENLEQLTMAEHINMHRQDLRFVGQTSDKAQLRANLSDTSEAVWGLKAKEEVYMPRLEIK